MMTNEIRELKKNEFSRRAALGLLFTGTTLLITGCAGLENDAEDVLDTAAFQREPRNRRLLERIAHDERERKKRDKVFENARRRQRHLTRDFIRDSEFEGNGGGGGGGGGG